MNNKRLYKSSVNYMLCGVCGGRSTDRACPCSRCQCTTGRIHLEINGRRSFCAYGIQEWIGYVGVSGLHGSYYNVMGLPVQRIYEELTSYFGLNLCRHTPAVAK